jgi:hypothetical protein
VLRSITTFNAQYYVHILFILDSKVQSSAEQCSAGGIDRNQNQDGIGHIS